MNAAFAVTGAACCVPGAAGAGPALERHEEPAVEAALRACARCLEEAAAGRPFRGRVGMAFAVGSAIDEISAAHARTVAAGGPVSPLQFVYTTPNAVTARLGILLGLDGESLTLPDAAAPFWAAAHLLAEDKCSAVLVGGVSPGPPGPSAAVLCLELPASAARRGRVPRGRVRLRGCGAGTAPADSSEAGVALATVAALGGARPVLIDCGRRGLLEVAPARRRG